MAIIKCKMCGGDLELTADMTVAECEYCGTRQTVPTADNDKKITLFARANRLRAACEFDKAAGIYESIVAEFPEEAEAYWGLVLCQYGIEYVDDPATGKKIPTCHRSSFESVMDDSNFEQAMENADEIALRVYREEAKTIERIRKGILEVSSSEQPYDIFICYKETDSHGDRTVDSLLAQNIYDALTDKGYRVFFSRITLEDKLGMAYEPYIFAALNSAKIMLAVGTCYEHYNAVWVKNEWSRFLKLMTQSKGKFLIPCYKNIDPYDIPKEFSHLQGQDMGKVGAIQDLLRGIEKIIPKDKPKETIKETVVTQSSNADIAPLLKRAFMFLEDGDWSSAGEYCEKVLDKDPECAEAYLGKLMAELRVRRQTELRNQKEPFDGNSNYQKAVRFAGAELKASLIEDIKFIKERNEKARLEGIYSKAVGIANSAKTDADFKSAAGELQRISQYKDSAALAQKYLEKAEVCRKDAIYNDAKAAASKNTIRDCEAAIQKFKTISGWKDADAQIALCNQKIDELKRKVEANKKAAAQRAKKAKRISIIAAAVAVVIIASVLLTTKVIIPNSKYNDAVALMEAGRYEEAMAAFEALNGYKDSVDKVALIYERYSTEIFGAIDVGENIFFGSYEQDNDTSNGKEEIEWLVLKNQDSRRRVLVVSKYVLDCQKYNQLNSDNTWLNSTLYEWLNNEFLATAFSEAEQSKIQNHVFLLSAAEASTYSDAGKCTPTDYVIAKGIKVVDGNCYWWLRSSGFGANIVDPYGNVSMSGIRVDADCGVRPAMWIEFGT